MKRLQAFKFRLSLNGAQKHDCAKTDGCRRFVYNQGLAASNEYYKSTGKFLGYNKLAEILVVWKKSPETAWLKEAPSQVLQQALKDLDRAFSDFFKKKSKYPQFKKRGLSSGFRFPQGFKIDATNNRLFLPKIGYVKYRDSRTILGNAKNITVSTKGGHWYASVQTERDVEPSIHPSVSQHGWDRCGDYAFRDIL
jgi:putative transposase